MRTLSKYSTRQGGAALITGLVFLVILTLLGFSASRGVIMQELIARNFRDQDLALQAAEAALKDAEACIRLNGTRLQVQANCMSAGASVPNNPYSQTQAGDPTSATWVNNATPYGTGTSASALTLPSGALAQAPQYIIAVAATTQCLTCSPAQRTAYQITALGTGINSNTRKILQSVYVR